MNPGLHLSNATGITEADEDIIKRWKPLSAICAMGNIVEDNPGRDKLVELYHIAGEPLLVLRKYFPPDWGQKPNKWGLHAIESVALARRCMERGVPTDKIILHPFNEINMPTWAMNQPYGEGFGDKPAEIHRYAQALSVFIDVAKNEEPEVLIGGPDCTVGNRDCRMGHDPQALYYYHGEDGRAETSPCYPVFRQLDYHLVHCYGFKEGEYANPYHGLRFVEYMKYLPDKPVIICEGLYGEKWADGSAIDPAQNHLRGRETVEYLKLLDNYSYVKGITLWIGGAEGWATHRHSSGYTPSTHRPVVEHVENYVKELEPPPDGDGDGEPPTPPVPGEIPPLQLRTWDGRELVGTMAHEYMRQEYGDACRVVRYPGSVFPPPLEGDLILRIVRLEETEGPHIVKCRTQGGVVTFGFRWDDGPQTFEDEWYPRGEGRTGSEVDFVLGPESIAGPETPGAHALWALGQPSDLADGWGWKPLTNHRALYVTFATVPYKEAEMPNEVDYPSAVWVGPAAPGNFTTGRQGNPIRCVVLHGTAKGENVPCDADLATQAINWFKDPASKVSAHYVVSRQGEVFQVVREADTAYHAGSFAYNLISIGIEGEHCGHEEHPWTRPTIDKFVEMLRQLVDKYSITRENVVRHKDIVSTDCPVGLPYDYILDEVFEPLPPEGLTDDQVMTAVYGAAWTDRFAVMQAAIEESQFAPVFASHYGQWAIQGHRVDWHILHDVIVYWLDGDWQTPYFMRWPPQ